jgi:hypothetical protein
MKCPQVNHIVRKTILSSLHLDAEIMASKQSEIKFERKNLSYLISSQIWLINVVGSLQVHLQVWKKVHTMIKIENPKIHLNCF